MAGAISLTASGASALVAIPVGTPYGSGSVTLTLDGTYLPPAPVTTAPSSPAPPFTSSDFVLSLTIPSQVFLAFGSVSGAFLVKADGSYTDNGATETFTAQNVDFQPANPNIVGSQQTLELIVSGLLAPGDFFTLDIPVAGSLVSSASSGNGLIETISTGSFAVTAGTANYTADPPFAGTLTSTASSIPEPSSTLLLGSALCLLIGHALSASRPPATPAPAVRRQAADV